MFSQDWDWGSLGLSFVISLALALWAIFHIAQSKAAPFGKAVWIVFVLFAPLFGFLMWLLFGPRSGR